MPFLAILVLSFFSSFDLLFHLLLLLQVIVDQFPDGALDTVNSAIFLRFINPIIGKTVSIIVYSTTSFPYLFPTSLHVLS